MNYDQATGIVRAIAPTVLAYLAQMGVTLTWWETAGVWSGLTALACIWSYINNKSGKVIKSTLSGS